MLRTLQAALMMLLMWILVQAANAGFGQTIVKTEKDDFMPSETMKITGMGWPYGETFKMVFDQTIFSNAPPRAVHTIWQSHVSVLFFTK